MTTTEYVQQNWGYFQGSWKSVGKAIEYYQRNPRDLENEKIGVDTFNGKERDVSTVRVETNPTPHKATGEIMTKIRQLHDLGTDVEDIRLAIGTVSFSGALPDYLAIGGIGYICRTGPSIVSKLTMKMKEIP